MVTVHDLLFRSICNREDKTEGLGREGVVRRVDEKEKTRAVNDVDRHLSE
jgi:hypothetical protein